MFVVATPIGNLGDISHRALQVLRQVDLIAAEDTRQTRKLLAHYQIRNRLTSYHAHSRAGAERRILQVLREGGSVALVSDAGTPAVSDPGRKLVAAAVEAGIPVSPVPGPSALIAALSISGLAGGGFLFEGFPPRSPGQRRRLFASLREQPKAIVLYEAPQRLLATLRDLREALGDRPAVVARELTKRFEEVARGSLSQVLDRFAAAELVGEFVLIVEGAAPAGQAEGSSAALEARANEILRGGVSARDAARQLAEEFGVPRSVAYQAVLKLARRRSGEPAP